MPEISEVPNKPSQDSGKQLFSSAVGFATDAGTKPEGISGVEAISMDEVQILLDWSERRRNHVVKSSEQVLNGFLEQNCTEQDRVKMLDLRRAVVDCFRKKQQIKPLGDLRDFIVGGTSLATFLPNDLPAHSEYHAVGKVLTLLPALYENFLPQDMRNRENALALSIALVVHDLGVLTKAGEKGFQVQHYDKHVERSISLVDNIVTALGLTYGQGLDQSRLTAKVKVLIAATKVALNMDFSSEPAYDNLPLVKLMRDEITVSQLTVGDDLKNVLASALQNAGEKGELLQLASLVAAIDHGTYLLEPCRLGEVTGLWQEASGLWLGEDGKLTHRAPSSRMSSAEYLASDFAARQLAIYGSILERLEYNPFVYSQSLQRTFQLIERMNKLLLEKKKHDPLLRFEGFFSPVQLLELAEKLDLADDQEVVGKLKSFSAANLVLHDRYYGKGILPTGCLQVMYRKYREKLKAVDFFAESIRIINSQMTKELTDDGHYTLHIAPFAYITDSEQIPAEFLSELMRARQQVSASSGRDMIDRICLTLREGEDEKKEIDKLTKAIGDLSRKEQESISVSLGGIPEDQFWLQGALYSLGEAGIPAVVHLGLEKHERLMGKRVNIILDKLSRSPDLEVALHIDGNYELFQRIYKGLSPEQANKLKQLQVSISPLGNMILAQEGRAESLEAIRFLIRTFKLHPASHNCSITGDLGLTAESTCLELAKKH